MSAFLGQLLIHASCMLYSLRMAKAFMSDREINAAITFQREQEKLEALGTEQDESATKHKPNLLNTVVWLVETAQQARATGWACLAECAAVLRTQREDTLCFFKAHTNRL